MRDSSRHASSRHWSQSSAPSSERMEEQVLNTVMSELETELMKKEPTKMRGFERLSVLSENLVSKLDAKCDTIADRIEAASARGEQVIARFDEFAADCERKADAAEDALRRLTNMPDPTNGSAEPQSE